MRRALLLGGALAALAAGWVLAAAPIVNETVAIVDPYAPSQQAGVDGAGNLKVNCTTGCSAGSGTGANNADAVAPVSTGLGASVGYGYLWNGTSWDRQPGSAGNGASANLTKVGGSAMALGQTTMAASLPVALANNQSTVNVAVAAALPAGANTIGSVGLTPQTNGGLSVSSTQVANNTTATVVKSGAGQLYGIEVYNNSATIAYVKLYNATSATCGSGTVVQRAMIPANASGAGAISNNVNGVAYSTGITMCVTGGYADSDTTAPAASTYIVNVLYK